MGSLYFQSAHRLRKHLLRRLRASQRQDDEHLEKKTLDLLGRVDKSQLRLHGILSAKRKTAPEGAVIGAYTENFSSYEDVTKAVLENGDKNANPVVITKSLKVVSNPQGTVFEDYKGKIPFPKFTYE